MGVEMPKIMTFWSAHHLSHCQERGWPDLVTFKINKGAIFKIGGDNTGFMKIPEGRRVIDFYETQNGN